MDLKRYTSNTITTISKFKHEIELIKKRGYAIGNEEHEYGLKSLATPYFNNKGDFVGAIGVCGLSVRLDERNLHHYAQEILRVKH